MNPTIVPDNCYSRAPWLAIVAVVLAAAWIGGPGSLAAAIIATTILLRGTRSRVERKLAIVALALGMIGVIVTPIFVVGLSRSTSAEAAARSTRAPISSVLGWPNEAGRGA